MNKFFLSLLIIFNLFSCSNLSKNTIESGTLPIKNGVFETKTWNDVLVFDRYSWYRELTLSFEFLIAEIPPQSGFNFWFSKDELSAINKCNDARIVMAYSLDTKSIPYSELNQQLEYNGFSKIELIDFKKNLLAHPDSTQNSLKLYHIFGICRKSKDLGPIKISFPGFSEKTLK